MFKTLIRIIKPNPLDALLKKAIKNNHKKILIAWNRAVGDLPLGLFAICHKIKKELPDSSITFLSREDLKEGFLLLNLGDFIVAPKWKRREEHNVLKTLQELNIPKENFDVIIDAPDISYSIKWQIGKLIPKLVWKEEYDHLWKKFNLNEENEYIAIQPQIESGYSFFRNWPLENFYTLFALLGKIPRLKIILVGVDNTIAFSGENIIDLRGKTTLLEVLSLIKNKCKTVLLPDSGLLTLTYYLDAQFPLNVVSLWANPKVGILGQKVRSPNPQLKHYPLISKKKNLASVEIENVLSALFVDCDCYLEKILKENEQFPLWQKIKFFSQERKKVILQELLLLEDKCGKKQKVFYQTKEEKILPLKHCTYGDSQDFLLGEKLLYEGKVAVLFLAGGEGTRLGFLGPKGAFPITNVKHKSTFQLWCEKIFCVEQKYKKQVPIFILTSSHNHDATINFFREKKNFRLKEENIFFVKQSNLPLMDDNGLWVLEEEKILYGASGNGDLYQALQKQHLKILKDRNIQYVNIISIENPLFDPTDPMILGYHHRNKSDVTIKCVRRQEEHNKGVLAIENGNVKIIEYLDIEEKEDFPYINIGFYCTNVAFLNQEFELPLHKVKKKNLWKYERFIFDAFLFAKKVSALCAKRDENFAPLKGKEDVEQVKKALLNYDRKKFFTLTGEEVSKVIELSPEFYYFPEELKKWKNQKINDFSYLRGKYL